MASISAAGRSRRIVKKDVEMVRIKDFLLPLKGEQAAEGLTNRWSKASSRK
jgi:hypothetical protein